MTKINGKGVLRLAGAAQAAKSRAAKSKAGKGKVASRADRVPGRVPVRAYPALPRTLPRAMLAEFRALVDHLRERGAWNERRLPLVEAYLVAVTTMRRLAPHLAQPIGADGKPAPALRAMSPLWGSLRASASALGLAVAPGNLAPVPVKPTKPATAPEAAGHKDGTGDGPPALHAPGRWQ